MGTRDRNLKGDEEASPNVLSRVGHHDVPLRVRSAAGDRFVYGLEVREKAHMSPEALCPLAGGEGAREPFPYKCEGRVLVLLRNPGGRLDWHGRGGGWAEQGLPQNQVQGSQQQLQSKKARPRG